MMEAIKVEHIVEEDGRIVLTGLPVERGETVSITLRHKKARAKPKRYPTVADWRASGLLGMWAGRDDIADSTEYVNRIREREEHREGVFDDPD